MGAFPFVPNERPELTAAARLDEDMEGAGTVMARGVLEAVGGIAHHEVAAVMPGTQRAVSVGDMLSLASGQWMTDTMVEASMQALGAARAGALPHGAGTGQVVVGGEGRQGMPRPVPLYYMRMLLERTQHATCMEAGAMGKAAGDVAERMRKVALLDGGSNDATVMVVNTGGE